MVCFLGLYIYMYTGKLRGLHRDLSKVYIEYV